MAPRAFSLPYFIPSSSPLQGRHGRGVVSRHQWAWSPTTTRWIRPPWSGSACFRSMPGHHLGAVGRSRRRLPPLPPSQSAWSLSLRGSSGAPNLHCLGLGHATKWRRQPSAVSKPAAERTPPSLPSLPLLPSPHRTQVMLQSLQKVTTLASGLIRAGFCPHPPSQLPHRTARGRPACAACASPLTLAGRHRHGRSPALLLTGGLGSPTLLGSLGGGRRW